MKKKHILSLFLLFQLLSMAQGHKFHDLEESGETLVAFINSSQLENLRRVKDEHLALFDQHTETTKTATQILKGGRSHIYLSLYIGFL